MLFMKSSLTGKAAAKNKLRTGKREGILSSIEEGAEKMKNKIILASASPRRKELLEWAGVTFRIVTGNGEESITKTEPSQIVEELSAEKAIQAAEMISEEEGTVIIGADTIVSFQGKILGKPSDKEDSRKTLEMLQGNTHQVYTGVTIVLFRDGKWQSHSFSERTDVTFYPVSPEEIDAYIETGDSADKAGSYGIQGLFGTYVKEIHGDYNNVVGLPVARLLYEGKKLGISMRG